METGSYQILERNEHQISQARHQDQDCNDDIVRELPRNISPPADSYNAVYFSFILGGAGFLLPYNSFIMAMDYFKIRYPGMPVVFDMSLVYIIVAFITVLANNLLVESCTLNSRINFGYIMSFITLIFVVICEIWWEAFGTVTSYEVNLAAVAIVAIGCTVQQSSFYGYTSMLPTRYSQAVMVGESASGVFTSSVRVITRMMVEEIRGSTIYFFTVSVSSLATCFAIYHLIRRTDFVQYYVEMCERAKTRIVLEPVEDNLMVNVTDVQCGVIKPKCTENVISYANPVYEPTSSSMPPSNPTYKVEDVVIQGRSSVSVSSGISGLKYGCQIRWEITKIIYPYMFSICLVFFTTLCLYPGIASEIISCRLGSWMPILMMAFFNIADMIGKMLASDSHYWSRKRLVRGSVARLLLVPLLMMCVAPRANPIFHTETTAFILAIFLGLSNGVLGSVPMIQAPTKVEPHLKELTGNMMTLLYNFGLTTGSLTAYFLESLLNPVEQHPCGPNPVNVKLPDEAFSDLNSTIDGVLKYTTKRLATTLATTLLTSTSSPNVTSTSSILATHT